MKTMNTRFHTLLEGGLVLLFSLAAISHAGAQTCVQPPSGLVSWWPGDGNADDITGGNDGMLQNGATFAPGKVGQAFSFDGLDDRVDVLDTGHLSPPAITLDAWVNPDSIKLGSRVVSKEISSASCVYPYINYSLDLRGEQGNRADFFFTTSDDVLHELVSQSVIPTGVFTHIAATYDGSVARIYVNGALENQLLISGTLRSGGIPAVLGNGGPACRASNGGLIEFDGLIDEVEIFNRALSASEIQAIFNAGSAGKCKAATVLDHFKCYKAKGEPPNVAVDIEDQFGVEAGVLVKKPEFFCNPVDKNGEGIRNLAAHLTCYKIKADGKKRDVVATNQFGEQTLKVKEPELLCVPSDKIDVIP